MKIHGVGAGIGVQQPVSSQRSIPRESKTGDLRTTAVDNSQDVRTETEPGELIKGVDSPAETVSGDENELMKKSIEQANQALKLYDRKLELNIHEVTKTIMYTLKDTKTNEVIAEFPPKKIQDMIAKMWELAGLFVDKKA